LARPRQIEDREILEAAGRLFLENGIARTEMSRIAQVCGVSRMTLYRHFDSRETIAFHLVRGILTEIGSCLSGSLTGENGYEQVKNGVLALCGQTERSPEKMRLLDDFDACFSDGYPVSETAREYSDFIRSRKSPLEDAIRTGVADGSIRPDTDPEFHAKFIHNALLGVAQRVVPRKDILCREQGYSLEYLEATAAALLRDLKPAG